MKNKKVLIFTDNFLPKIGGAELVIYNIAKHLSKKGYDVLVLCGGYKKDNEIVKEKFEINFKIVRYPYAFKLSGRLGLNTAISLLYLLYFLVFKKYNIVHSHFTYYPGYSCALLKKIYPIKYIITPHGEDIQILPSINYGIRLNKKIDKKVTFALQNADFVTFISKTIFLELEKIPNIDLKRTVYIPNGLDRHKFVKPNIFNIREIYNLEEDSIILLSVGRNHLKKNFQYSINAMKILESICRPEIWKKIRYVIIGKNVKENKELVEKLLLQNKIILSEPILNNKLVDCFKTSNIFINPTLIESFGLVNIEAMAAGLPLVVTDVPGNIDVVNENVGLFTSISNPTDMAEKINILLNDIDLRNRFSKQGIEESSKYDWNKIIDEYIKLYDVLLG